MFLEGKLYNCCTSLYFQIKKPLKISGLSFFFAVRTGLEPATLGVTGRYSNQLNYRTKIFRTSCKKPGLFSKVVQI